MAIQTREDLVETLALIGIMGMARAGDLDSLFTGGSGGSDVDPTKLLVEEFIKEFLISSDEASARNVIGAGTSNLQLGTTSSTAKAGNYTPSSTEVGNALKAKTQVNALSAVSVADATDGATAATLSNANKVAINAIIAALKA